MSQIFISKIPMGIGGTTIYSAPPIYKELAAKTGLHDQEGQLLFSCAWYICRCAMESIESQAKQVTMEDETDATSSLRNIVDSVLRIYGGPDINEVMAMMRRCRKVAFQESKLWDPRWQAWLDSGGRAYNTLTREEKAINDSGS